MRHGGWVGRVPKPVGLIRFAAGLAMLVMMLAPALGASAAVTNTNGWEFLSAHCSNGSAPAFGAYVNGPGAPPLGYGSFNMSLGGTGAGYAQFLNSDFSGVALSSLTALNYSTFVQESGVKSAAAFMLVGVDLNGDGSVDDQLIFQPAAQATVQGNVWQTWDALDGNWWSLSGNAGMGTGTAGKPLSAYIAAYPGARIENLNQSGGLGFGAGCIGSGWQSFDGAVDAAVIGVNTQNYVYDFEADGVHLTGPTSGDNRPSLPVFSNLTPAPFSTVKPGSTTISAEVTGSSNINQVTMQVDSTQVTPTTSGANLTDVTASATQNLTAGTHTITMTATDVNGKIFKTQWDVVVSSNLGENEWFNADGTPKADQINATITSLVQAFRYHLYGQSWDGKTHPEIPTHANAITQAAPLSTWVNGSTFDEASTNATLTSLVQAFRWHFWGISWDGKNHPEMPTHATIVLPPQSISAWFTPNGKPIPQNISATLQSLVQAFRWHFWGYSWDGQHHFTDMPTHAY